MSGIVKFNEVNSKIIAVRNEKVILDSDVAELYGVETREVNQAVKNNSEKFPEGYILSVQSAERQELIKNFDRFKNLKHSISTNAFTEKGLYMLATILKSPKATATTIAIVEAFAKIRELSRAVAELSNVQEPAKQKSLVQRSGEIIADILDSDLEVTDAETTYEINAAIFKIKHTVKRKAKNN